MFQDEEWIPIVGLEHYLISNCGRVKHVDKTEARKTYVSDAGFLCVLLYGRDSKTRNLRHVNKLVATAFCPPPFYENEKAIWHIDGDLLNCRYDNLKWDTMTRVREWNEMNRSRIPSLKTPRVKNNRTGVVYENALEAGLGEGMLEGDIVWRVERQAAHDQDDNARYRYLYNDSDM